jgi:hypothetical protein
LLHSFRNGDDQVHTPAGPSFPVTVTRLGHRVTVAGARSRAPASGPASRNSVHLPRYPCRGRAGEGGPPAY